MTVATIDTMTFDPVVAFTDLSPLPDGDEQEIAALFPPSPVSAPLDAATKERLIVEYLPLAEAIARRSCPPNKRDLLPDLIQEASIRLIEAVNSYDWTSGSNFAAYATVCIRGTVRGEVGDDGLIAVPYQTRAQMRQDDTTLRC
jgi:DNA-directed RNA polymerase specialized sigma subunit